MANYVINSVNEFNVISKAANNELKNEFSNPFIICNLLEKAAKGDFEKVSNVKGLSRENLANVAFNLKKAHKEKHAFNFAYLLKSELFTLDYSGKLCTFGKYEGANDKAALNCGEIVCDTKGNELRLNNEGEIITLKKVSLTIIGIFNAFKKTLKADISKTEKAEKAAKKAAEKAAKATLSKAQRKAKSANEKAYKELCAKFYKGEICAAEFAEKAELLKKAA